MGKTVTTYLIDGDPKGTQYAFISNKICQMFVVPRSNLSYLNTQEKLQKPAFYILLGEDESTKPQASTKRGPTAGLFRIMRHAGYSEGFPFQGKTIQERNDIQ